MTLQHPTQYPAQPAVQDPLQNPLQSPSQNLTRPASQRGAPSQRTALIIGAGIIGLCTARALAKAGMSVTMIDPQPPGSQCSFGNAGALSSGSVAPLAMPGILRNTASMLFDAAGPLHIPARYWAAGAPWLWQFVQASSPARVAQIAAALHGLLEDSVDAHAQLARDIGHPELVRRNGQLHVYPDATALSKDAGSWALKAEHGLRIERVDQADIQALEPGVSPHYQTGIFLPDEGSLTDPYAYCQAIAQDLLERGVTFHTARITSLARSDDGWRVSDGATNWEAAQVVVSAGVWSTQLLKPLGWQIPLQTQRGYHVQWNGGDPVISRIVVLVDRKVFLNPMSGGLRVAGTVEIDALERPANHRRAQHLSDHARHGLRRLPQTESSTWMGHRPCLPDSMPVLGAVPDANGLWCAFGHGHLGITESVNTASWLAAEIQNPGTSEVSSKIKAFSISRFSRRR